MPSIYGAVAQLGERSNRTAEVVGSIPSGSTINPHLAKAFSLPEATQRLGLRGTCAWPLSFRILPTALGGVYDLLQEHRENQP